MKRLMTICVVAGLTLVLSPPAKAMITVDADAYAPGTILNNLYPGATLTALGAVANSNVLSEASAYCSTGSNVFSHTGTIPPGWGNGIWEYLRVDFAAGATQVWLDFIADDNLDANPYLRAYDSSNNLLATATVAGNYSAGTILTLTVSGSNIAYITATGDVEGGPDDWNLDNLRANVIPAPGGILLGGIGVGFVGWLRRRRTL